MKEYIKQVDVINRKCTHPKVEKYHEWGGGTVNGPFIHHVTIHLTDGSEHDFKAENRVCDAIEDANNFLNKIPE